MAKGRKARILDIALESGVSTATVDRVLNERPGVRPVTVERVRRALEDLERREAAAPSLRGLRGELVFEALLPAEAGPSTERLLAALQRESMARGAGLRHRYVERFNPSALAEALRRSAAAGRSGIAFQALDHPLVSEAVEEIGRRGVPLVTLLSDIAGARRDAYVGMDNRAAGRTAGLLMGRFVRGAGSIAVMWGSSLYRAHEERESGFRSVLRAEFPEMMTLEHVAGHDDSRESRARIGAVLDDHPELVGIYNVGGGTPGVVQALEERGRGQEVVLIGHNLAADTRGYLLSGIMDAVVHQSVNRAAQSAVSALVDLNRQGNCTVEPLPVEVLLRENMPARFDAEFTAVSAAS